MRKRPTVKDVAERAGVTIGTVSHVINGTAPISEQTMRRVRQAIKELDYVPNSAARNIRKKESNLVGMLVPKITNDFYSLMASTFMDEADKENIMVMLIGYGYSREREERVLHSLLEADVGTVIIVNSFGDDDNIRYLVKRGIRVILADRRTSIRGVSSVEYDNKQVLFEVMEHLRKKGYGSVGYLSEPLTINNLMDRFEGYRLALEKNGYEYRENHVFISDAFHQNHMENSYWYTKKMLREHRREELPEAFIASSDMIAIGAMRAIREEGYEIPGDFGIAGFDDVEISSYLQPALTTVRQDRVLMGKELWRLTKAGREGMPVEKVHLPQELMIRESC